MVAFSSLATLFTTVVALSGVNALPRFAGFPEESLVKSEIARRSKGDDSFPALQRRDGAVPLRVDIDNMDADSLNLFILGLQAVQQQDISDPESFYQVAGIHGRPYQAWDNIGGGNPNMGMEFPRWLFQPDFILFGLLMILASDNKTNYGHDWLILGYCTHADILFCTWHRPYLQLYENILWQAIQNIAAAYPAGATGDKYRAIAPNWRWVFMQRKIYHRCVCADG